MPECDYCGASFDSEGDELEHLKSEHRDELGPIDKRRVGDVGDDDGLPVGPIALGVVIFTSVAIVGYVVLIAGGSSGVGARGSAHYHGTMEMSVLGDPVDFSRSEYQLRDRRFHFEEGDGTEWHAHATGVTFQYAMESLGFEVSLDPATLVFEGETYGSNDGFEVVFEVNGERLSDLTYVLQDGDSVRVVVREA